MDSTNARRFVERSWDALAALEHEHWAREFAQHGPRATLEAAVLLWEHMRRIRPDWPSDAERQHDLIHHLQLKGAIDRAAGALHAVDPR
jgi:hypothetical protein